MNIELDIHRVTPRKIAKDRLTKGLGVKIAVQYISYWDGIERPTWGNEEELKPYGNYVVKYWARDPVQIGRGDGKYRQHRAQVVKRAKALEKGETHVLPGYIVCCDTRERPGVFTHDIVGS